MAYTAGRGVLLSLITALPLVVHADPVEDLVQAWALAVAPPAQQGDVVLGAEVSVEDCQLTYEFTSGGGTVTDAYVLPLASLDVAATRVLSDPPTSGGGVTLALDADAMGETIKTLANGRQLSRAVNYGPLFGVGFTSDEVAFAMLEALYVVADACRAKAAS